MRPMMNRPTAWWAAPAVALALLIVAVSPAPARYQQRPEAQKKQAQKKAAKKAENPQAGPPLSAADAREILEAFRVLSEAVRTEEREARSARVAVDRPGKTVADPGLTADDLDRLIDAQAGDAQAAPITTDEEFLRRLTLDVAGRPPTAGELADFLADSAGTKRAGAIDRLLATDDHARRWARYWKDVIRYKATFDQPALVNYKSLEDWLFERFKANTPWDEVASQMIAGTGKADEEGQTVFATAHGDGRATVSAPEFAGEVSRIFLGVQIQCAQCHDHLTDPWTREQFHQFAAFFAGTQARRVGRPGDAEYGLEVVSPTNVPRYAMPDLDDPTQVIPVSPGFFLASDKLPPPEGLKGLTTAERRELAASLVTGQDNPWFARAFVNRLWYELMGDAFVLPVDDLGPTREPAAPEVFDALSAAWQRGGYDVRWLYRTILNTSAYQRQSRPIEASASGGAFAANCPSPLRPDEVAAALAQALDLPEGFMATPLAQIGRRLNRPGGEGMMMAPPAQGNNPRRRLQATPERMIDQLFGIDPSTPDDEVRGTIPQALFLMNNPFVQQAISRRGGPVERLLRENEGDGEALEAAYRKVLARAPTEEEKDTALAYVDTIGNRREAFEDLYWALLNSAEFLSRR